MHWPVRPSKNLALPVSGVKLSAMPNVPDQQPDPLEKSLGDQATGADVSRVDRDMSLGDQSTTGDALSSLSDLGSGLGEAIDSDLPLIDLAARYEIEGELGQGGMGAVLLATDRQLKRKVAIKRILGSMAQSKTARQRFITEAQSIASLNHFNIVQVYDFGRDAEGPLLVLEYVGGGSLLDKLKGGKLEIEEAVDITCQLCDALGKAHGAGIIHRDIKPANILLTEDGKPKLTDFGLARQESVDHGQTQAGAVLGTIDYMPPEQRQDATATDARSDLWSLAATFYEMITGKSPKVIKFNNVPQALQDILGKALEDVPEERYQTATELGDALRHSISGPMPVKKDGLQQGQCPSCHVINELKAKFCESCQAELREPCLNCGEENGAWAAGCTQCGSSHEELAEKKRAKYEKQKKEIAKLRVNCSFDEAIVATKEMSEDRRWRLKEYQQWATNEVELINQERDQRRAERNAAAKEVRKLIKADQLEDAVRVLEQVPAAMRNQSLKKLEKQIEERNAELLARIQKLIGEAEEQQRQIKARHAEGNYQAAIVTAEALGSYSEPELAEYVAWAEEQLQVLQAEWSTWHGRRISILKEAQTCYEAVEYTTAIELLSQLPSAMASDPGDGSPEAAAVARLIKQSKERISEQQARDLFLEKLQAAETQVPILCGEHRHAQAIELLEPLVDIDDPQLNDLVEKARKQLAVIRKEFEDLSAAAANLQAAATKCEDEHNYQEAVRLLEQIPEPFREFESRHLLSTAKEKSENVQKLREEIRAAWKEKKFSGLLHKVSLFLELKPNDPSAMKLHRKLKLEDLTERIMAATTATAKLPLVEEYRQLRPADDRAKQLADKLREQVQLEEYKLQEPVKPEELKKAQEDRWQAGLRKQAKRSSDQDTMIECPICSVHLKSKNLPRHLVKVHKGQCPQCGSKLKTKLAKQCFECGADWHGGIQHLENSHLTLRPAKAESTEWEPNTFGCLIGAIGLPSVHFVLGQWWYTLLALTLFSIVGATIDSFSRNSKSESDFTFWEWAGALGGWWAIFGVGGWVWNWFMG